jgi:hypothetical protein
MAKPTSLYIVVHCCTLLYIVVHCCTLLYIVVHCCTLLPDYHQITTRLPLLRSQQVQDRLCLAFLSAIRSDMAI